MLEKYFYIQSVIDRLKSDEEEALFQAERKRYQANIIKENRINLENALREQKKEDDQNKKQSNRVTFGGTKVVDDK